MIRNLDADLPELILPDGSRVVGRVLFGDDYSRTVYVTHETPESGAPGGTRNTVVPLLDQVIPDDQGLKWARRFMRTLLEVLIERPDAVREPEKLRAMLRALPPPPTLDDDDDDTE